MSSICYNSITLFCWLFLSTKKQPWDVQTDKVSTQRFHTLLFDREYHVWERQIINSNGNSCNILLCSIRGQKSLYICTLNKINYFTDTKTKVPLTRLGCAFRERSMCTLRSVSLNMTACCPSTRKQINHNTKHLSHARKWVPSYVAHPVYLGETKHEMWAPVFQTHYEEEGERIFLKVVECT